MLGVLQAKQKLNLRSIGLLITSFTVLIVLGRAIVGEIGLVAVLNASWTPEVLGAFLFALPLVGYATVGLGVAVFVYYGFRTHFQVDKFAVKKQFKKTFVIASLVFCGLFLSSLVTTPLVSAGTTATTGYYLATPYSPFDWLVGKYSTGSVYAINGSNWANMMTFPTTTWASYASNASKVQEYVLGNITAGTVYLKEVAFDYDCTIPANVQVIENVNGLTRTFVDDAESQGSPYTVSVDTVNPTYYTVQDCADRFIISWTSTNATYAAQSAFNNLTPNRTAKETVILKGNLTFATKLILPSYIKLDIQGQINAANTLNDTLIENAVGIGIDPYTDPVQRNIDIEITGGTINGNKQASWTGTDDKCTIHMKGVNKLSIHDLTMVNGWTEGIRTAFCDGVDISNNNLDNAADDDIAINAGTINGVVTNNICTNAGQGGVTYGASCGIEVQDGAMNIIVSNNYVWNTTDNGIQVSNHAGEAGCKNIVITGNIVNNTVGGIWVQGLTGYHHSGVSIIGNLVNTTLSTSDGITINYCDDALIQSNKVFNSVRYGITVYYPSELGVVVNDNTVDYSGSAGIYVFNGTFTIISNNKVTRSLTFGILTGAAATNTEIFHNTCVDNGRGVGGSQVGIGVYHDSGSIRENSCYDSRSGASITQQYGIVIYSGAENNLVSMNVLYNNSVGNYSDAGTGTVYKSNFVGGSWVA